MPQSSRNLLVKFYYKIKLPAPPPSVFAKVVEIMICQPCYATDLKEISVISLKLPSKEDF